MCEYLSYVQRYNMKRDSSAVVDFLESVGSPLSSHTFKMAMVGDVGELQVAALILFDLDGRNVVTGDEFLMDLTKALVIYNDN